MSKRLELIWSDKGKVHVGLDKNVFRGHDTWFVAGLSDVVSLGLPIP